MRASCPGEWDGRGRRKNHRRTYGNGPGDCRFQRRAITHKLAVASPPAAAQAGSPRSKAAMAIALARSRERITGRWYVLTMRGLAIFLVVFAGTLLRDGWNALV